MLGNTDSLGDSDDVVWVDWRSARYAWLREYIDANIDSRLRIADLSRLVQLSASHFSHSFKSTFGRSPHAYIMRRRVERATVLMLASDCSLGDIAMQCGFADQAHFSRHFRLVTGVSPAAWRRTARVNREGLASGQVI
jgi:AraC-like DNA-binding protein